MKMLLTIIVSVLWLIVLCNKINRGHTFYPEKFRHLHNPDNVQPSLLKTFKCDTIRFSRDYYITPVDYILVHNNSAALPTYIVQYSYETRSLQIRSKTGIYCSFHNEHHGCSTGCDGHAYQECLGTDTLNNGEGDISDTFERLTAPCGSADFSKILAILEDNFYS
jgi:hypothetical protein